jgi:hypothetical protein
MEGSGCCRRGQGYGLRGIRKILVVAGGDWNHTIRVESQEPLLLLLIGHDIDQRRSPLSAISILELLKQDLDSLAVGSVHGDEVNAFGILSTHISHWSCLPLGNELIP